MEVNGLGDQEVALEIDVPKEVFRDARLYSLLIVTDPVYRENLLRAARSRILPPQMEVLLWHYAFGKPPDRVELGRPGEFGDLRKMSTEQLALRARNLATILEKESIEQASTMERSTEGPAIIEASLAQQSTEQPS